MLCSANRSIFRVSSRRLLVDFILLPSLLKVQNSALYSKFVQVYTIADSLYKPTSFLVLQFLAARFHSWEAFLYVVLGSWIIGYRLTVVTITWFNVVNSFSMWDSCFDPTRQICHNKLLRVNISIYIRLIRSLKNFRSFDLLFACIIGELYLSGEYILVTEDDVTSKSYVVHHLQD